MKLKVNSVQEGFMNITSKSIIRKCIVFLIYAIISIIITYPVILHINSAYIGTGADPELFMWFIKWVQFSIEHLNNPLVSKYILLPDGVNLMWNTSVILASFILSPITKFFGVVVSYNIIVISGFWFSAFAAYIATLRFVNSNTASFFSGLIYGYSPYMIAQSFGHPHVTLAFIPPLLIWLGYDVLVSRKIGILKSGTILGILLFCQLILGEELLASEIIIGIFALAVAGLLNRKDLKQNYSYVVKVLLIGTALSFVLSSPFLFVQFLGPAKPSGVLQPQNVFVTDMLNFIVPGPFQLLKTDTTLNIVSGFTGNASEWGGYIGIPFLLIILYTTSRWYTDKKVKFLAYLILITVVLSMGPYLHINGHTTGMPLLWSLFGSLPLLEHLLPGRLMLYVFLLSGIMIAIYISNISKRSKPSKFLAYLFFTFGLIFIVPALPYPVQNVVIPSFFTDSIKYYIPENSNVFIVPMSQAGEGTAMMWQTASDMWFRMPEGYAINSNGFGPNPSLFTKVIEYIQEYGRYPPIDPGIEAEMYGYLKYNNISYVIVGPTKNDQAVISFLDFLFNKDPVMVDGIYIWKLDNLDLKAGYFITGDKYNIYYRKMDWIGRQIEITTYNVAINVQISGEYLLTKVPINISIRTKEISKNNISERHYDVDGDTNIILTFPPNSYTEIVADRTWVPDKYIHNGDRRDLSVLFKIEGIN